MRAPILRRYLEVAPGGRAHFPIDQGAPLEQSSRSPSNTSCSGSVPARMDVPPDIALAVRGCSEIAAELCGQQRPHPLSHSAGLANPIPIGWVRHADAPAEDLDAFNARLVKKHSRLRGEPGKRASYSNLGYLVLGEVIQAAGGAPYVDYVRAQILEPLGMTTTDFVYRGDMAPRAATGYHPRFNISTPLLRLMTPAGIGKFWALSRFCVQGAPYGGPIGTVRRASSPCTSIPRRIPMSCLRMQS